MWLSPLACNFLGSDVDLYKTQSEVALGGLTLQARELALKSDLPQHGAEEGVNKSAVVATAPEPSPNDLSAWRNRLDANVTGSYRQKCGVGAAVSRLQNETLPDAGSTPAALLLSPRIPAAHLPNIAFRATVRGNHYDRFCTVCGSLRQPD